METKTYVASVPHSPHPDTLPKDDPKRTWTQIGDVEFSWGGGRYLDMRPVDDPGGGGGFCLSRGAFTRMIVLINTLHYDAPKINRKPLPDRMYLDGVHRLWIDAGDLEYSFDGIDRVDLVSKDSEDPHRRKRKHVYSFNLYALYRILALFDQDPYAE